MAIIGNIMEYTLFSDKPIYTCAVFGLVGGFASKMGNTAAGRSLSQTAKKRGSGRTRTE